MTHAGGAGQPRFHGFGGVVAGAGGFDVEGAQFVELQHVLLAFDGDRLAGHRAGRQGGRAGLRPAQVPGLEAQARAAVAEARLVDGDAVDDQRVVDLDGGAGFLAALLVGDHHVAGKALGHAVAVVVDVELLERDVERQVLHEVAVAGIEEHHVGRAAFGQGDAAAERQVAGTQPAGIRDLALRQVASFRRDAAEEFGHFQRHVAVDQAADADDHEGDVGEEVAQLVGRAFLGCQHQAVFAFLAADSEALGPQVAFGRIGIDGMTDFGRVRHGRQRVAAGLFAPAAHFAQEARGIAPDAQPGRQHEEDQDDEEPRRVVDVEQP